MVFRSIITLRGDWQFAGGDSIMRATLATELGILAVRGFADMGESARDLMIRNKFIAAQQSCDDIWMELQRMLPLETLWIVVEFGKVTRRPDTFGSDRQDPDGSRSVSQVTVLDKSHLATAKPAPLQQDVGHVVSMPGGSPPRVTHSSADRELLIQSVLEAVRSRPDDYSAAVSGTGVGIYAT